MSERVYMNRRQGEERIHIEIPAEEIPRILADFTPGPHASVEALSLHRVLVESLRAFGHEWPEAAA